MASTGWPAAALLAVVTVNLAAWSRGGLSNRTIGVFFALSAGYVVTITARRDTPPEWLWLLGMVELPVVGYALRARVIGAVELLDGGTPTPGAWRAWRARVRIDRALRQAPSHRPENHADGSPDIDVAALMIPDRVPTAGTIGHVLTAAARRAGSGDLLGAVDDLGNVLARTAQLTTANATIGLVAAHRAVYAALAAIDGTTTGDPHQMRHDRDVAVALLPDIHLTWLTTAAVALAEGRRDAAWWNLDRASLIIRGPWERGIAVVLARHVTATGPPLRYMGRRAVRSCPQWIGPLADRAPSDAIATTSSGAVADRSR